MRQFSPFRLDDLNQCLWRKGPDGEQRVPLAPKAYSVLCHLVDHAGQLVTQRDLLQSVWGEREVDQSVLKMQILELRAALGDDAKNPTYIETLPKRGYRFVAQIQSTLEPQAANAQEIVGREPALAELSDRLRSAAAGKPQIVFITGESGIGKTALVDEFSRRALSATPDIRVARGQCLETFASKDPYYPVLEALEGLCRGPAGRVVIDHAARHAPMWLTQMPALLKPEHRELLRRELVGTSRERMLREVSQLLEVLATENVLVVIVEDLQWADHSTVDLLAVLARQRKPIRLLMVGTLRSADPVFAEHPLNMLKRELLVHGLCSEVRLEPLGEADVKQYLASGGGNRTVPDGLAAIIHGSCAGNPLFMHGVIDHLLQRGLLARQDGGWQLQTRLSELHREVPDGLRQIIEAQLDRLSAEEQCILDLASVAPTPFSIAALSAAGELALESVEESCETLARRKHFLREAGTCEMPDGTVSYCYEFMHTIHRQVINWRMAARRRATLNRRLAEWLEATCVAQDAVAAAQLAELFEQAGEWSRAVKYLCTVATMSRRRCAHDEAIIKIRRAMAHAARLPEREGSCCRVDLLRQLAETQLAGLDPAAAIESYELIIAQTRFQGAIEAEARALLDLAWPAAWSDTRRALDSVVRAIALSARLPDPVLRAGLLARAASIRINIQGWNDEAAAECRRALEEVKNGNDPAALAECQLWYGSVECLSAQYSAAYENSSLAATAFQNRLGDERTFGPALERSLLVSPTALLFLGKWDAALDAATTGAAHARASGDCLFALDWDAVCAWIYWFAHDYERVVSIGATLTATASAPSATTIGHILVGASELQRGHPELARTHLDRARLAVSNNPSTVGWYWRAMLRLTLADLCLEEGNVAAAQAEAAGLLDFALASAERTWQTLAWNANARAALARNDSAHAATCVAAAIRIMEGLESPIAALHVLPTAADQAERAGDRNAARQFRLAGRTAVAQLADSLNTGRTLKESFLRAPQIAQCLAEC